MAIEIYTVLNLKTSTVRHYHISYAISRESITQTCSLRCLVGQATVIYMSIKQVHTGYLLYIYKQRSTLAFAVTPISVQPILGLTQMKTGSLYAVVSLPFIHQPFQALLLVLPVHHLLPLLRPLQG